MMFRGAARLMLFVVEVISGDLLGLLISVESYMEEHSNKTSTLSLSLSFPNEVYIHRLVCMIGMVSSSISITVSTEGSLNNILRKDSQEVRVTYLSQGCD